MVMGVIFRGFRKSDIKITDEYLGEDEEFDKKVFGYEESEIFITSYADFVNGIYTIPEFLKSKSKRGYELYGLLTSRSKDLKQLVKADHYFDQILGYLTQEELIELITILKPLSEDIQSLKNIWNQSKEIKEQMMRHYNQSEEDYYKEDKTQYAEGAQLLIKELINYAQKIKPGDFLFFIALV